MTEQGVLITGAGGFLGRYILERYLEHYPGHTLFLLEHGLFLDRLKGELRSKYPDAESSGRVHVFQGDITQNGLGLDTSTSAMLKERVTAAIHLAALYHLAAPRDVLMRINVQGTRNLLDFLGDIPGFQRLAHISTLAVAGTYEGVFDETDFDCGQSFKNYYEETKYLSEGLVRERMDSIPSVIFRPPVVVGHSRTGHIEKVDGPYYLLNALARNVHFVMPDCGAVKCHIAPVDFVTDGIVEVFERDATALGAVCALMDPDPVAYNRFVDLACESWPKSKPLLRMPFAWMKPLARFSLFETITGIPWQAFQYGDQPIEYTLPESTRRLAGVGLHCPRLPDYIATLVAYFKEHLQDSAIRRGGWKATLNP